MFHMRYVFAYTENIWKFMKRQVISVFWIYLKPAYNAKWLVPGVLSHALFV